MVKLLHDDAAILQPDIGSYTNVDLDQGIADFVGTAPGSFATDFAVSERPLTSAEAATAAANGRSFAYVPFAATPVALMTLVPNSTYQGTSTISSSQFCQHIDLDLSQLDGIYGVATPSTSTGPTAESSCTTSPTTQGEAVPFSRWGNLDPTMENYAMMSLLDSTHLLAGVVRRGSRLPRRRVGRLRRAIPRRPRGGRTTRMRCPGAISSYWERSSPSIRGPRRRAPMLPPSLSERSFR